MKAVARILLTALLSCVVADLRAAGSAPGPLRVGAARVDITPASGALHAPFIGVLDPIYSRAIVVDNGNTSMALVSIDVLFLPDAMARRLIARIAALTGISADNIAIAGTGTHSIPMGRPGQAPAPGEGIEPGFPIDDQVVESVRQAQLRLQPARIAFGTGVAHVNVNRDRIDPQTRRWTEGPNYEGESDKTVAVLKFETMAGAAIAVYYNYAVFNVLTGTTDLVSGDLTGAASRYIEESLGEDVVAAFSLGAHGDQNPLYYQQTYDLRDIRIKDYARRGNDIANKNMPPPGGTGLDRGDPVVVRLMEQQKQMRISMGQMLGEEVLHVSRNMKRFRADIQLFAAHKTVSCPGRERINSGRAGFPGTYKDADPQSIELGLFMIGDVAIGMTNGLPYSGIARRFKEESPYKNSLLATRVNGMATGGYIPDDASYGHDTFAVLSTRLQPGCAEDAIVNGVIELMPRIAY